MSYNPLTYWKQRSNITPYDVPERVKSYITDKIKDAETVLDFGIGEGRLLPLYGDREVTGCDIVFRDLPIPMTYYPKGKYDVAIASKVLLHIKPDRIEWYISQLKECSDRVIVWDAIGQDAPHVFDHDFSKYGTMKDVQQWDNQLLFCYENNL